MASLLRVLLSALLLVDLAAAQKSLPTDESIQILPVKLIPVAPCPVPQCVPPCLGCKSGECTTKPSFFDLGGRKCPSCPVLDKCLDVKIPCPLVKCVNPCTKCKSGCTTEKNYFDFQGMKCLGCPTLDKCLDKPICPIQKPCRDPCQQCKSGRCTTRPVFTRGLCPSCPVLEKCLPDLCPDILCKNPCDECDSKKCTTKKLPVLSKCPTCLVLDKCVPVPKLPSKCCAKNKPLECRPAGCTCCSNGQWIRRRKGQGPKVACRARKLELSKICPKKCCSSRKPSPQTCGRSGCKCCSNGKWALGNSGPNQTAKVVCARKRLRPSTQCPKKCCAGKKPSRVECGRSGCTCCSDGQWVKGNSGPTVSAKVVCGRKNLTPSMRCTIKPTPKPTIPPPKREQCGRTLCAEGLECCNPLCGTCVRPGGFCTLGSCPPPNPTLPPPPTGDQCGRTKCAKGLTCCNASCGICVKPGNSCIQIACAPDFDLELP